METINIICLIYKYLINILKNKRFRKEINNTKTIKKLCFIDEKNEVEYKSIL